MEISTSKNDLLKELTLSQGVVERKNTIPILSNLLFEVDESTLRISATDLDLGIRCSCPAKVKEGGSGTIPAKRLFEIVRSLPDAEVRFKLLENHYVQVNCERSSFKLVGMAKVAGFPRLALDGAGQILVLFGQGELHLGQILAVLLDLCA